LSEARSSGNEQKIRDALSVCEKNALYQKAQKSRRESIPQYNACQKNIAVARAAGDLRKIRRITTECKNNIYFVRARGYPGFDAEKYEACRTEIKNARDVARLNDGKSLTAHQFCFRESRGPVGDMFFSSVKIKPD